MLAGITFGADWVLVPYLFLFSVLLAQSVIDLELYRLLDRITFPALAVSVGRARSSWRSPTRTPRPASSAR